MGREFSLEDRLSIHELVSLHGHLMDDGAFERFGELFTPDVVYDVSSMGGSELVGIAAVAEAALALGDRNPLGHHVTNVVIVASGGSEASVRSKGIGVLADGSTGSVVYEDLVVCVPDGWRIAHRRALPRRTPLQACDG
jgi:hypothetical protein